MKTRRLCLKWFGKGTLMLIFAVLMTLVFLTVKLNAVKHALSYYQNANISDYLLRLRGIAFQQRMFASTNRTFQPAGQGQTKYRILWYIIPPYLKFRPDAMTAGIGDCEYSNCELTFNRSLVLSSHVVLFDGRFVPERHPFQRPPGQVWVFAAHETPLSFDDVGKIWRSATWADKFNWTMTYDRKNTDIFLPYGELWEKSSPDNRDFKAIAANKTKQVLMINSHCQTRGKREQYANELKKYIDVDVLGSCGRKWNCGTHYKHDDCFKILNTTYRYFLAYENALCRGYFTEKFYENYEYDILIVSRGGQTKNESTALNPKGTHISTGDFNSPAELGKFLKDLSSNTERYADMLKAKSRYHFPGYTAMHQRAMCDICKRMNNLEKYRKTIPDIQKWAIKPCREADDM